MRFSMLYSGEQILSFKSCLVLYAGDSLSSTLVGAFPLVGVTAKFGSLEGMLILTVVNFKIDQCV